MWRRVMLDSPLKRRDPWPWTFPETCHVVVHVPCYPHGSRDNATQGMPLWERAPCLWASSHAMRCLHIARYPLYPDCPQETRTRWHTSPLYNKCPLHATSSSLDAMLGLAAQHARSMPPNTTCERCCSLQQSARVGDNSCHTTSSSLDATASLAADHARTGI